MSASSDSDASSTNTKQLSLKSATSNVSRSNKGISKVSNKHSLLLNTPAVQVENEYDSDDSSDEEDTFQANKLKTNKTPPKKEHRETSALLKQSLKTEPSSDSVDSESDSSDSSDTHAKSSQKLNTKTKSNTQSVNTKHNLTNKINAKSENNSDSDSDYSSKSKGPPKTNILQKNVKVESKITELQKSQTKGISKQANRKSESDSDSTDASAVPSNQEQYLKSERKQSSESEASFSNVMSSTQISRVGQFSQNTNTGKNLTKVKNERISSSDETSESEHESKIHKKPVSKKPDNKNGVKQSVLKVKQSQSYSDDSSDENTDTKVKLPKIKTEVKKTSNSICTDSDNSASDFEQVNKSTQKNLPDIKPNIKTENDTSKVKTEIKRNSRRRDTSGLSSDLDETAKPSQKVLKNVKQVIKKHKSSSSEESSNDESNRVNIKKEVSKAKNVKDSEAAVSKMNKKRNSSGSGAESSPLQNSFISQKKLGSENFAQNILKQKAASRDTSDESDSETERKQKLELIPKIKRRESISPSGSDTDEPSRRNLPLKITQDLNKLAEKRVDLKRGHDDSNRFIDIPESAGKVDVQTNLLLQDISEEEEVWLMQCPKDLDPELLVGQKLKLGQDAKRKLKLGGNKYECISKQSDARNICLVASESSTNNHLALKIIQPAGSIVVYQMLKQEPPLEVQSPEKAKIEPPNDLKVRHPIFGSNFKEKLKLDESVKNKLKDAELNCKTVEEKKKKKLKKKKIKVEDNTQGEEVIFELLNRPKNSAPATTLGKKIKQERNSKDEETKAINKKKKRKRSGENLESCRETMIEDILRSTTQDLNISFNDDTITKHKKHKKLKIKQENVKIPEEHSQDIMMDEGNSEKIKNKKCKVEVMGEDLVVSKKNKFKAEKSTGNTDLDTDINNSSNKDKLKTEPDEYVSKKKHKKKKDDALKEEEIINDISSEKQRKKKHKKIKTGQSSFDEIPVSSQTSMFAESCEEQTGLEEETPSKKHKKHKNKDKSADSLIKLEYRSETENESSLHKKHKKSKRGEESKEFKLDHNIFESSSPTKTKKKKKIKSENYMSQTDADSSKKQKKIKREN